MNAAIGVPQIGRKRKSGFANAREGANYAARGKVQETRQIRYQTFLSTIAGGGRKITAFGKKQSIFVQGDPSDAVFYVQKGKVRLTVVSKTGKEATIGILNEGSFFGEGCLTGQNLRLCSATAMTDCTVMKIREITERK